MAHNRPSGLQRVGSGGDANQAGSRNPQVDVPIPGQASASQQGAAQPNMFSGAMATLVHQMHNNQAGHMSGNMEVRRSQEVLYPQLITQGQGVPPIVHIGTAPTPAQHTSPSPTLMTQGQGITPTVQTGTATIHAQDNNPSSAINISAMQGVVQGSSTSSGFPQISSLQAYQSNVPVQMTQTAIPQTQAPLSHPNVMYQPNPENNAGLGFPMVASQPGQPGNQVFGNNGESIYVPSHGNYNLLPVQYVQQGNVVVGIVPQLAQPAQIMQLQPTCTPDNQQLQGRAVPVNATGQGFQMNGTTSPSYVVPSVNEPQVTLVRTQNKTVTVPSGPLSNNVSNVPQPVQSIATVPSQFQGVYNNGISPHIAAMSHAQLQPATQYIPQVGQMMGVSSQGNLNQSSPGNDSTVITPSNLATNVQGVPMSCAEASLPFVQSQPIPTSHGNQQQIALAMVTQQGITGLVQQGRTPTALHLPVSSLRQDTNHASETFNMPVDSRGAQSVPESNESSRPTQIDNQANPNSQQNEDVGVLRITNADRQLVSRAKANEMRSQSKPSDDAQLGRFTNSPLDEPRSQRTVNCPQPSHRTSASSNSTSSQSTGEQRIQQVLAQIDITHGLPQMLREEEIPALIEEIRTGEPFDPRPDENQCPKTFVRTEDSVRSPLTSGNTQDLTMEDVFVDSAQGGEESLKTIPDVDRSAATMEIDKVLSGEIDQTANTIQVGVASTAGQQITSKHSSNVVSLLRKDDEAQHEQDMEIVPSDSNEIPDGTAVGAVTRTEKRAQDLNSSPKNQPTADKFSSMSAFENQPADLEVSPNPHIAREYSHQECQSKSEIIAEAWEALYAYDWTRMKTGERRKRRSYIINRKRLPVSEQKIVKTTRNCYQPICFRRFTDDEVIEISKLYPRMVPQKKGKKVLNRMIAQRGREQKRQTTEKLEKENEKLRYQNSRLLADIAELRRASAENVKLRERLDSLVQSNRRMILTAETTEKGGADTNNDENREVSEEPSEVTEHGRGEKDACT